jgi:hypothetical protein
MNLDNELTREAEFEDFELQNIREVKARLEQAVKSKAVELRSKYGVEQFVSEDLENLNTDLRLYELGIGVDFGLPSDLDSIHTVQDSLFRYLIRRKNIMDNVDIDLYLANVLINYAKETESDFRQVKDKEYGKDLAGKLLDEAEALLQKPSLDPLGRAYQTYLLGRIEMERIKFITDGPEADERIGNHYKRIIRFLEESRYYSRDIPDARDLLISAYDMVHGYHNSPEEKPHLKKRFDELNAENPQHMKEIEAILAKIEQRAEQVPNQEGDK